jgi:hypothetical protein
MNREHLEGNTFGLNETVSRNVPRGAKGNIETSQPAWPQPRFTVEPNTFGVVVRQACSVAEPGLRTSTSMISFWHFGRLFRAVGSERDIDCAAV